MLCDPAFQRERVRYTTNSLKDWLVTTVRVAFIISSVDNLQ